MIAVIQTGGKQYKVSKGDIIDIERLDAKEGENISIKEVLLIDNKVGAPYLENAKVEAKIVEHKRGEKIKVFKMKAKKRYQKTQGHRQELTTIEITEIKG